MFYLSHMSCQQKGTWFPKDRSCSDLPDLSPQDEHGWHCAATRSLAWDKNCRNRAKFVQKMKRQMLSFGISFLAKGIKHYMKSKVLIDILLLLQLDISRDRNLALIPLPTGYMSETLNLIKHFSLTTAFPGWKNLFHCVLEILFSEYPFSLKSKLWCFDRASIYFRNPVTSSWSCPSWHSNIMTVTEVLIFVFFPNFAVNMLKWGQQI